MRKLLYLAVLAALASCRMATHDTPSDADSVPQSVFAPLENDTTMPVNLKLVTGVDFPKYKITQETPLVPDSASIAADEETVASGNFSAVLTMDTVAPTAFFHHLDSVSKHDSCWQVAEGSYRYRRSGKGVNYTVAVSPESKIIHYTQMRTRP